MLARAKISRISDDDFFQCVTPLRALMLKIKDPESFEALLALEANVEAKKNSPDWEKTERRSATLKALAETVIPGLDDV